MEQAMVTQSRRRVVDQIRTIARKLRKIAKQSDEHGFPITELDLVNEAKRFDQAARSASRRVNRCRWRRADPRRIQT
jgi:hypothetical protein